MTPGAHLAPPEHLSDEAKALWERITEEAAIDSAAAVVLRTLCDAYDRRNEARAKIKELGAVFVDRFNNQKMSPWVAIERDTTQMIHRAFRLLGFDQEARGEGDQTKLVF
jgi:P27 family predicted phage terminase small subunit